MKKVTLLSLILLILTPPPSLGIININELISTSIRGTFSMNCTGTTGTIQITNGTFKGNF